MMGIPRFTAIINPPNSAILAVGTTVTKPVVKNGQIVVGQVLTVTLSADHRAFDGAVAAQYLGAFKTLLESPRCCSSEFCAPRKTQTRVLGASQAGVWSLEFGVGVRSLNAGVSKLPFFQDARR